MLELCLLGCGGMMPLPYRKLTSLMARYNGNSILIDCGEGTQVAIKEKGWSFKPIEVICFTHYHADHISGLPGLLLTLGNAQRTEPLLMVGPRGLERVVNSLRVIAPDLPFPIVFHELKEKEEVLDVCGCRITAFRVNHNITCYGYTIEIDRAGKFDVNKAKENNVEMHLIPFLDGPRTRSLVSVLSGSSIVSPFCRRFQYCISTLFSFALLISNLPALSISIVYP